MGCAGLFNGLRRIAQSIERDCAGLRSSVPWIAWGCSADCAEICGIARVCVGLFKEFLKRLFEGVFDGFREIV